MQEYYNSSNLMLRGCILVAFTEKYLSAFEKKIMELELDMLIAPILLKHVWCTYKIRLCQP